MTFNSNGQIANSDMLLVRAIILSIDLATIQKSEFAIRKVVYDLLYSCSLLICVNWVHWDEPSIAPKRMGNHYKY